MGRQSVGLILLAINKPAVTELHWKTASEATNHNLDTNLFFRLPPFCTYLNQLFLVVFVSPHIPQSDRALFFAVSS